MTAEDIMGYQKSKTAQFFIAFFMGVFILALPFSYALFRFSVNKKGTEPVEERFYPQVTDSLSLVTAVKNNANDRPNCFIITDIDPYGNEISFAVLPPETLVEDGGSFHLACDVWDKEGAKRGAQALQSAAGIENGRWLELDSEAVIKLGEVMGAIDFTLQEEISIEQGLMVLPEDRQLIDGTKAVLLINYEGYSEGESSRLDMIGKLLYQTISQRVPLMNDALLIRLFETAVNNGSSDMTIGDFEARRRSLGHMINNDFEVEQVEITGEYSGEDNTFFLSSRSIEELIDEFSDKKEL